MGRAQSIRQEARQLAWLQLAIELARSAGQLDDRDRRIAPGRHLADDRGQGRAPGDADGLVRADQPAEHGRSEASHAARRSVRGRHGGHHAKVDLEAGFHGPRETNVLERHVAILDPNQAVGQCAVDQARDPEARDAQP